jgi:hypothetical protein
MTALAAVIASYHSASASHVAPVFASSAEKNAGDTGGYGTWSVNKPTGTTAGDLLVLCIASDGFTKGVTISTPAGWTNLVNETPTADDGQNYFVAYKIADGTEGSSFSGSTPGSGGFWACCCARFTGCDGTTPIDASADTVHTTADASPQTIVSPSVTATVDNTRLIHIAMLDTSAAGSKGSASWTAPTGFTSKQTFSDTGHGWTYANFYVADNATASAGATGTISSGASPGATAGWCGVTIALRGVLA